MIVSYSGLGSYNKCPSQFQRKYVTKEHGAAYVPAPAAERGTRVHKTVEDLINGKSDTLHEDVVQYTGFFLNLREQGAQAEKEWCLDRDWGFTDFEDHENGMIRGFIDVTLPDPEGKEHVLYELKTGKEYDDHPQQRNLYGMVELLAHPEVERVRTIGVYMDLNINRETIYHQSMLESYKYMWQRKINKVQPPQPYPMRPGWYCRFCPYSKENGGKCPN